MSEYLPPYLSLDVPIKPPGPNEGPVCFTFDAKWIPYILAVLKTLTLDGVYSSDQANAKGEASLLLEQFMSAGRCAAPLDLSGSEMDDCMGCCIRMREGILQVLQCGQWVTVDGWDASTIASSPVSGTNGTPVPPAGSCQTYIGKVNCASRWALPASVNTGDTINVTNALGSWWTPLDLAIQRCPDGLIYFGGGCIDGTDHTEPTDPLNTAPHDALIAYDGTHYYDCSAAAEGGPASFTIGSGVVAAALVFMTNTPDTVGFGDVQFDVEICNNQAASWIHDIDFIVTNGGFFTLTEPAGTGPDGCWIFGSGWENGIFNNGGGGGANRYSRLTPRKTFTSPSTLTRVKFSYNSNRNGEASNGDDAIYTVIAGTLTLMQNCGTPTGTGLVCDWVGSQLCTGLVFSCCDTDASGVSSGAVAHIYHLRVEGTGFDPFV